MGQRLLIIKSENPAKAQENMISLRARTKHEILQGHTGHQTLFHPTLIVLQICGSGTEKKATQGIFTYTRRDPVDHDGIKTVDTKISQHLSIVMGKPISLGVPQVKDKNTSEHCKKHHIIP
jgi:hypothetical protein